MSVSLKAFYESQADIPETLVDHYVEQNGKWFLALDGGEPVAGNQLKAALEQERKGREKAMRDLREMQARLSEIEQQRTAQPEPDAKSGSEFEKRLEAQQAAFAKQMDQLRGMVESEQSARKQAEERLWQTRLDEAISRYAAPLVHEGAIDDVLSRARQYFRPGDDGMPVPYDGDTIVYGSKDPTRPMPVEEFVAEKVLKQAKHLLRPSQGAGTQGGNGAQVSGNAIVVPRSRDIRVYEQAKALAEKTGKVVQFERAS